MESEKLAATIVIGALLAVTALGFVTMPKKDPESTWKKKCNKAESVIETHERCEAQENCIIDTIDMRWLMKNELIVEKCKLGYQPK